MSQNASGSVNELFANYFIRRTKSGYQAPALNWSILAFLDS